MGRWLGILAAGYAGFALAVGIGIPVWIDWPTWQVPADATDIGVLIAYAAAMLNERITHD